MTIEKDNLICLVDWLSCTIKTMEVTDSEGRIHRQDVTLSFLYLLLGIPESEWIEMPRGLHGYHHQKACGDIRILYGGTGDMGMHIQMSGQGCRQWETYWGQSWETLFGRLWDAEANFSRLDIAVDDIRYGDDKPYFKVADLIRRTKRGLCRSKWRKAMRQETIKVGDGSSNGHTIYYGSNQSLLQLRIYEKNKERQNAGHELEEDLSCWNRIELQLSDDRAQTAVHWVLKGMSGGELMFGILSQYINFTDNNGDENKARWPISQFWLDFLGDALKLKLAAKAPDKTIPSKQAWIQEQVEATIAEVWYATGGRGEEAFVEMLERGLDRMSETQWMRAEAFRSEMEFQTQDTLEKRRERKERYLETREVETANLIAATSEAFREQQKGDAGTSPKQDLVN